MIDDWLDRQVCDVFGNINLGNHSFQCDFITHLRNIEPSRQTMLSKIHDINTKFSPLEICSYVGISQLSEWCLDNQANDNIDAFYMRHPLYIAFIHNHHDIVMTLLNHEHKGYSNGDLECYSKTLYEACASGKINIVLLLLKEGVNVNATGFFSPGRSPLYVACERGHIEIVTFLLDYKADEIDINITCFRTNDSPLYIACKRGHTSIVSLLLNHVADEVDVNTINNNGETPLYTASEGGYKDIVDFLLARPPIMINKTNKDGSTPLLWLVEKIVQMLLKTNADVNICLNTGENVQKSFMKYNFSFDKISGFGKFLGRLDKHMYEAFRDNASDYVKLFLDGKEGEWFFNSIFLSSPLHMSSLMGHTEIVKLLVERKSTINCFNENGSTPLFLACELGHEDIVHELLVNGANPGLDRKKRH
ncbi:unnamed protein product [Mytilus edulis]|uniref:Ankyrin repeat protein n=1 Tax=Mytilus edulis TaxID=6550 RepID=A0A8S3Q4Y1_MYTED|nr:unnamed protein product [Mytilus edulis]